MAHGLAMSAILFCLLHLAAGAAAADRYSSVSALRSAQVEGKDFRVDVEDRQAAVTVLAIHGGDIEKGTSEIARALAGTDWNLYDFEGLLGPKSFKVLHVTASNFDDPPALGLASAALVAVTLHGESASQSEVCVGGGSSRLRKAAAEALKGAGFSVEQPCRRLPGKDSANIVNVARKGGLQLELNSDVRQRLISDEALRARFAAAVREAVSRFLRKS